MSSLALITLTILKKNGSVQIYAIPSATSEDVKKYPVIEPITSVDIDTFLAD